MPHNKDTPIDHEDASERVEVDVGTAEQAIEWALHHNPDGSHEAGSFLRAWSGIAGAVDEWPDYLDWVAGQAASSSFRRNPAMTERDDITRPIIGLQNRTPLEVFDIMVDRIRGSVECPNCRGMGETTGPERGMPWFTCQTCGGKGEVSEAKFHDFHVSLGAFHHD